MTIPVERNEDALQSALRVARENEARWMEMSPKSSADSEGMDQWAGVARLRRLEVERLEALLKATAKLSSSP